jgi:cell wall-associated NlpC family hydrolase
MLRKALASVVVSLCFTLAASLESSAAPATYTVSQGDTLSGIAQRFHLTVDQLVTLNHLGDANVLSLGEVLRLSPPPAKHRTHQVATARRLGRQVAIAKAAHRASARRRATDVHGAEMQALWVATHTSSPLPSFIRSLAIARHIVTLELRVTRTALRYLGVPYEWGGESFAGVDCSGFVQAVFRHNGIELPRTADAQFDVGRAVTQAGLEPGDLVFFQTYTEGASHVGIYLGDGRFVHASASDGVRVDSLSEDYYAERYLGARRESI